MFIRKKTKIWINTEFLKIIKVFISRTVPYRTVCTPVRILLIYTHWYHRKKIISVYTSSAPVVYSFANNVTQPLILHISFLWKNLTFSCNRNKFSFAFLCLSFFLYLWKKSFLLSLYWVFSWLCDRFLPLSLTHTNIHTPTNAHTHPHPNTHYLFLSVYLEFSCLWEDWSICSICFWNCSLICSTVALSLAFFV